MNIVKHKNIFFVISLVILIPGVVSLCLWGLKPAIDFSGGSQLVLLFDKSVTAKTRETIQQVFDSRHQHIVSLQTAARSVSIRTQPLSQKEHSILLRLLSQKAGKYKEEEFTSIGPSIGRETTINAITAVLLASVLIVLYIAWSFRHVPRTTSSWRFGICAIAALIHDALIVLGTFSLLGHFSGVTVDSLFVTAVLTVIGFSVHDTIVVFDRIRENLRRPTQQLSFPAIVNQSMLQTMTRSLNTSLTVILILITLLLFGGESIRWFVFALLIGIISGTYSSIFNASLLLAAWHQWREKRKKESS